jgi:phage terminase large subunit-like protein
MMTWMAGNTVARPDEKENIYPTKSGKANRIDGIVALIMAMGRFLLTVEQGSLDDWLADPVVIS